MLERNLTRIRACGEEIGVNDLDIRVMQGTLINPLIREHLLHEERVRVSRLIRTTFLWSRPLEGDNYWSIIYRKVKELEDMK